MLLNLFTALLLSVPAGNSSQSTEPAACTHVAHAADVAFDSTLISPPLTDSASVEATLLSGMDYLMLPTHGHFVRFIVRDDRLTNGSATFAFNTQTLELTLEQGAPTSNQAEFSFAVAQDNTVTRMQQAGSGPCAYQFMGPTRCFLHTWYGYYCMSGSWYCYLFGSTCIWMAIGSCK